MSVVAAPGRAAPSGGSSRSGRSGRSGWSGWSGRSGRSGQVTVLVVLAWAAGVLPRLAQTLTEPKSSTGVGDVGVAYSLPAQLLATGLTAAVALWCVLVVALHVRHLPWTRHGALLVLLAPWGYIAVRDLYVDQVPRAEGFLYPLVVVAVWVLAPRLDQLAVLGRLVGVTAVTSLLLGLALPGNGIDRLASGELADPDKAILPGGLLVGPLTSANNLGQYLVLGLPAVGLLRRRGERLLWTGAVVLAVVWTASRSSLAALGAMALVVAVLSVLPRVVRPVVAGAAFAAAAAAVALLPFTTSQDTAFTNRGLIWRESLAAWSQHRLWGLGTGWYDEIAGTVQGIASSAFHGHNQVVQTLVTGGLVQLALCTVLGVVLLVAAAGHARRGASSPTAFLVSLAVSSTLEVSFGFVDRGFLLAVTVLPVAFLALARPAGPTRPDGPDEEARLTG